MYGNSVINRCEARFQSLLPAISEANEQREELNLKTALLRELPIWEVRGSTPLKPALNLIVSQQAVQGGETKAVSHSKVKACSSGQVASLVSETYSAGKSRDTSRNLTRLEPHTQLFPNKVPSNLELPPVPCDLFIPPPNKAINHLTYCSLATNP